MLLAEEISEDKNIYVSYYDSSNILCSKYIYHEKKLAIIFSKGHQYVYEDVLPFHYQSFKIAKSQAVGLKQFLSKYKYQKSELVLDSEMIAQISKKITELKK